MDNNLKLTERERNLIAQDIGHRPKETLDIGEANRIWATWFIEVDLQCEDSTELLRKIWELAVSEDNDAS